MKKLLLVFGVLFLFSFSALAASFPDVPADHKNYEAIEYLDEKEIINGYKDGTFGPGNLVKRAEALKIIIEAFEIKRDGKYEILFPDVPKEEWFFAYIMAANEAKIVDGYVDGKFKPNSNVNLAESLKMILLAAKVAIPKADADLFVDVSKDDWFVNYALYASKANIIIPDESGKVHPDQAMTRAGFAELVYRLKTVLQNGGKPFAIEKNWPYYESDFLPFKIKYDNQYWKVIDHQDEVVLLKPDKKLGQFSAGRVYPNSGVVRVALDKNEAGKSKKQYFDNIKEAFDGANYTEFQLQGFNSLEVVYPERRIVDWYVYMEGGKVLTVYTEYGSGSLGFQLQQQIKAMLSSLEYQEVKEKPKDYSEILNKIFEAVLVEGKGKSILDLISDKLIIETDAIGVGTGAVDYYYSPSLGYTLKYERASDVILDTRKSKTSAF